MDMDITAAEVKPGMLVAFGLADVEVAEAFCDFNDTVVVTFVDGDRRRYAADEVVPVFVP